MLRQACWIWIICAICAWKSSIHKIVNSCVMLLPPNSSCNVVVITILPIHCMVKHLALMSILVCLCTLFTPIRLILGGNSSSLRLGPLQKHTSWWCTLGLLMVTDTRKIILDAHVRIYIVIGNYSTALNHLRRNLLVNYVRLWNTPRSIFGGRTLLNNRGWVLLLLRQLLGHSSRISVVNRTYWVNHLVLGRLIGVLGPKGISTWRHHTQSTVRLVTFSWHW